MLYFYFHFIDVILKFINTEDTILCSGDQILLEASGANISPSLVNSDDIHSGVIDIGFDFNFYGNTYTQCVISANGYITFDLTQDGLYSPWDINFAIPNPGQLPENAIMAPWHDIDPFVGGNIVFGTYGSAPNRVFYIVWCNMPMFQCNELIAGQYLLLFESSNKIEIHIEEKPLCATWNDGAAILGLVNENSTLFKIVDDPLLGLPRNYPNQWTATNEGWEFVPFDDFSDYNINAIDYSPIATGTVEWSDQYGNIISDSLSLLVTPDTGSVYYYISVVDVCTDEIIYNVDSILIQTYLPANSGLIDVDGQDSTIYLCDVNDGDELINLYNFLGNSYQNDGDWFLNNSIVSPQLAMSENSSGNYSYVTYGISDLCNDTAFLDLNINKLPDAGVIGYSLVCSGDSAFYMFNNLNGNPQVGGTWYDEDFNVVSDLFDPSLHNVGEYTYVVEGLNACPSDSQNLIISYQEGFQIDTYSTPVSCFGYQDGSITLFAENNTVSPVSYSIDGGSTFNSTNNFNNLEYGIYQIAVKDGNGCITEESVEVASSSPPINVHAIASNVACYNDSSGTVAVSSISGGNTSSSNYEYYWFKSGSNELVGTDSSIQVPSGGYYLVVEDEDGCQGTDEVSVEQSNQITFSIIKDDISCKGFNDGHIDVTVTGGGTPPYSFNWLDQNNLTTNYIDEVTAGIYNLEISDSLNCTSLLSVEITESLDSLEITTDVIDIACYGASTGSAQVFPSGGTPPYSYHWSSGHVTDIVNNLSYGTYYVDVIDNMGCSISDTVTIIQNNPIINDILIVPVSCNNGSDGAAYVNSSGGTGQLSNYWSNESTDDFILNQIHGEYWIKVEDAIGCYVTDTFEITQPMPLKIQLNSIDVKCFNGYDGQIISSVNGGTSPYSYDWSFSGNSFSNNPNATNLPALNQPYLLTVTDDNSCENSVFTYINQPESLELEISSLDSAYCLNIPTGGASVVASGGFLNTNSNYSFIWSSGENNSFINNKNAGLYYVIVNDDNNCSDTLNIDIPLHETFNLSLDSDSLICFSDESGSATVTLSGGYAPYNYQWNSNNGITEVMSFANSNTLLGLSEGVTSVVVSDANGCTKTGFIEIYQPDELIYSIFKENDESCSGEVSSCDGKLACAISGGIGNYSLMIFDLNYNIISEYDTDSLAIDSSLCAGFYQISVTDEHGCSASLSGNGLQLPVEIIAGSPVESVIDVTAGAVVNDILCYGDTSVSFSVLNPNSNYVYEWYVNDEFIFTGQNAVLPAGDIHVRAVASNTCYTNSEIVSIDQPSQLNISYEVQHVDCFGDSTATINIDASGGTPSYYYSWTFMGDVISETDELENLSSGSYTLTLLDDNSCERIFEIEVLQPLLPLTSNPLVSHVDCFGGDNGSGEVLDYISGGTAPYGVNWQGQDSTALSAGNYPVLITDANNCSENIQVEVNQPTEVIASFNVNQVPFIASASGGTPPYDFDWLYFGNQQSSSTTYDPVLDGLYTLVVTDNNGCEGRDTNTYRNTVEIFEFDDELQVFIYPNPVIDNFLIDIVSVDQNINYSYKLIDSRGRILMSDNFKNSVQIERDNLSAGMYMLYISSDKQCIKQKLIFSEK